MKKSIKFFTIGVFILMVLVISGLAYLQLFLPDSGPAPDLSIDATPQVIERGRYLANNVSGCIDCHSQRDWTKFSAPVIPGTEGMGGELFGEELGLPGSFYAPNITPVNLADWTDGELYRLITSGVKKDGEPIFPIMPYPLYSEMDPEDVKAIIAYVRTLEPVLNEVPASAANFPVNLIMRTFAQKVEPKKMPDKSDTLAYGKYLTTIAACTDCHTPKDGGQPIDNLNFAGGFEFPIPPGSLVRSANITPDEETGIGFWTKDIFVERFKMYQDSSIRHETLDSDDLNTIMPWTLYADLTEEDLTAIYTYLKSIDPIRNEVEKFPN